MYDFDTCLGNPIIKQPGLLAVLLAICELCLRAFLQYIGREAR